MIDVTALILTYNEAENIERTLAAVQWVRRVVILDSGSTDRTDELAKAAHPGVIIEQRTFDTHARQWNHGLSLVDTEWVLSLDADYEISEKLADEIQKLEPPADVSGYEVSFEYRIFGRSLRASLYPARVVLFRRARCSYYDEGHTQRLTVNGKVLPLQGRINHDDRKPLSRWIQSQVRYAEVEANHLLRSSAAELNFQDRIRRRTYLAPILIFCYLLVWRGLILDGWRGWYYVSQRVIAEFLLSIRLLEAKKDKAPG